MGNFAKICITAIAVIVFIFLFAAAVGASVDSGQKTVGVLGLILLAGLIGALRAIWKKPKNNDDDSMLQK